MSKTDVSKIDDLAASASKTDTPVTQSSKISLLNLDQLANNIKAWGKALGFQHIGICDIDLSQHEQALQNWLDKGYHGDMTFFERNQDKRLAPQKLHPETVRIISVSMNYLPPDASFAKSLKSSSSAYISRYALGRDYHKVVRKRLGQLADKIQQHTAELGFRPFVDSAPVLEHAIAEKAGIGWTGKHSLTLNKESGSWFFLGELFINLPLPTDQAVEEACGTCNACISICPTQAIVEPYVVDARRCISYLTIENSGPIPLQFRKAIGNRIYGCDDCQLVCPWNKYAQTTDERDFFARQKLHQAKLIDLFNWSQQEFLDNTLGSPIRRIGYVKWKRNIAVALGNASDEISAGANTAMPSIIDILENELVIIEQALILDEPSGPQQQNVKPADDINRADLCMLLEHIQWAIKEQQQKNRLGPNRQTLRLARSIEKGTPQHA